MAQFRIVTDEYCGYEVQCWRWWYPFWVQAGFSNTHPSAEKAEEWARRRYGDKYVVKHIGQLSRSQR